MSIKKPSLRFWQKKEVQTFIACPKAWILLPFILKRASTGLDHETEATTNDVFGELYNRIKERSILREKGH
jgi:hypothetical protein